MHRMKRLPYLVKLIMWKRILLGMLFFGMLLPVEGRAAGLQLPPFLPEYYAPAFEIEGSHFQPIGNKEKNGVEQFTYATQNQKSALSVERIQCDRPRCLAAFNNL